VTVDSIPISQTIEPETFSRSLKTRGLRVSELDLEMIGTCGPTRLYNESSACKYLGWHASGILHVLSNRCTLTI
jgi:hypothetical protein